MGLGLALVRDIAQHHGGEVRYSPREGGGSRFEVELAAGERSGFQRFQRFQREREVRDEAAQVVHRFAFGVPQAQNEIINWVPSVPPAEAASAR